MLLRYGYRAKNGINQAKLSDDTIQMIFVGQIRTQIGILPHSSDSNGDGSEHVEPVNTSRSWECVQDMAFQ